MQILDGKVVSSAVKEQVKLQTQAYINNGGLQPHLAAILVGTDGASETYVASKIKNCAEVGFKSTLIRFEASITQEQLTKDDDFQRN